MNRREFTKLFAVTPAVLAASNALAAIPEAKEPIAILDAPRLDIDNTLWVDGRVMDFKMEISNQLSFPITHGDVEFVSQGRQHVNLKVSIPYIEDTWSKLLLRTELKYIRFTGEASLIGRRFMIADVVVTKDFGMSQVINIEGVQVRSNDIIDTTI